MKDKDSSMDATQSADLDFFSGRPPVLPDFGFWLARQSKIFPPLANFSFMLGTVAPLWRFRVWKVEV